MEDPHVLERMRDDWNARASEDANYYVAFGRRNQDEDEFFASATGVVQRLERDLPRLASCEAALEIGCGPGRLMKPLSRHFKQIHGVDVSDTMIRLARERLRETSNAFAHLNSGADLSMFPSERFQFVYSYAVFQHIPSRDVVFHYLIEARRVLQTGGILHCQINGLPPEARPEDTWCGVRVSAEEVRQFMLDHDFQLLGLEQARTQYMWLTARKRPAGWVKSLPGRRVAPVAAIRNSTAATGDAAVPTSGPSAALSLWIEGLPEECDLNHLTIGADGLSCSPEYIGIPLSNRAQQVNAWLPEGIRTGVVPLQVSWLQQPVCPPAWVRIIPPGPLVPRILAITDGINLVLDRRTASRIIKVNMVEVTKAESFCALLDGLPVLNLESFLAEPRIRRYEFNFHVPEAIGPGPHTLRVEMEKRVFPPTRIEVL
jgi:SAM-dependent methyltransferase